MSYHVSILKIVVKKMLSENSAAFSGRPSLKSTKNFKKGTKKVAK